MNGGNMYFSAEPLRHHKAVAELSASSVGSKISYHTMVWLHARVGGDFIALHRDFERSIYSLS